MHEPCTSGPWAAAGVDARPIDRRRMWFVLTAYREALARTTRVQKTGKGAPAYSRFVNRWFGRRLAAAAFVTGRTPNQVTAVSAVLTFTAIVMIAVVPAGAAVALTITLLLVAGYALDSADGQLARLRGGGTPAGEWLDHVVDAAKNFALHAAVLVAFYRGQDLPAEAFLLVPLCFAGLAVVWFSAFLLTELLSRQALAAGGATATSGRHAPLATSLLKLPLDYGVLCLVFVTFGSPRAFFWCYAVLFAFNLAYLPLTLISSYRRLTRVVPSTAAASGNEQRVTDRD